MLVECNYMNEGCAGGWSMFNGYFAEQAYLTSESCAPYKARTKGDKCSNYKKCPAFANVESSYYINGYNFDPNVQQIQKELLMYGPVVTEMSCDNNF